MNEMEKIYDMALKKIERAEDYNLRKSYKMPKIKMDQNQKTEYLQQRITEFEQRREYVRCDICFQKIKIYGGKRERWCIDHDHKTGKIRGLLCIKCNHMLGVAEDNQEVLLSAVQYLKNHLAI